MAEIINGLNTNMQEAEGNPFARVVSKGDPGLGSASNIEDTLQEENEAIKQYIPQEANTDEGFAKMLKILGKAVPEMPAVEKDEQSVFSKVETPTAQPMPVKPVVEAPKQVEQEDTKADKDTEKDEDKKALTPSEQMNLHYEDEEILPLLDSLLTKGYASETLQMRKYNIVFRTTFSWEDQEIVLRTDKKIGEGVNLRSTGSYFFDLYSLAANLEQFGANYYKPIARGTEAERQKSFDERVEFLSGLGSPFITLLVQKRIEFIKKVQFLVDNYDRLLKVF